MDIEVEYHIKFREELVEWQRSAGTSFKISTHIASTPRAALIFISSIEIPDQLISIKQIRIETKEISLEELKSL